MSLDDPRLREGLDRLRDREWYAAHESFEAAWLDTPGEEREFIQALLHVAVAFEHLARGNPAGTRSQWHKARRKLQPEFGPRIGLDVAAWTTAIQAFFDSIDLAARAAGSTEAPVPDPSTWPTPS